MISLFSAVGFAQNYTYSELTAYEARAAAVLASAQVVANESDLLALQEPTRALILDGVSIMKLYALKNPVCQVQFDVMLSEIDQLETMTNEALHDRYHDGKGLPAAPKHCYFGRSQVVHPAMVLVRLTQPLSPALQEGIVEEIEEVIHHLVRIQKNLDNPPVQ
ncbi:MAG: hypothetical protein V4736_02620 [Bdellovibrionota bacterium]